MCVVLLTVYAKENRGHPNRDQKLPFYCYLFVPLFVHMNGGGVIQSAAQMCERGRLEKASTAAVAAKRFVVYSGLHFNPLNISAHQSDVFERLPLYTKCLCGTTVQLY